MIISRFLTIGLLAVTSFGATDAFAQGRNADIPAEIPPSSYTARQYVDSKGCVFIRAGIDGAVTWVPRVTRGREQLCGATPSVANAAPTPRAAPQQAEQITITTPAPAPAPKVIAPAPRVKQRAAAPTPAPRPKASRPPVRTVASIPASKKPAQRVIRAAPAPVRAQAPVRRVIQAPVAPSASASSRVRTVKVAPGARMPACTGVPTAGGGYTVRCGAEAAAYIAATGQTQVPSSGVRATNSVRTASAASGSTRIVPHHVYEARDDQVVTVPKGYRPAFDDGRLNRQRANQSIEGYQATQLVWTSTVPRRLIDRRSGRDVTVKYPKLIYPYTDYATQNAALSTQSAQRVAPSVAAAPLTRANQGRFVQVGTFGVPSNATRTAARLQGMGLPVRLSNYSKGGKAYKIVMAGPFNSSTQISSALSAARQAGFSDAFVR
ncbi:SPOR domain-containing protein [Puniceibacterium sp. IMCC21224]|uniref:SPOR domain-containing protein n=1 Tax=Puniceibacterium sp. IMCC21224 TaxID=1618204 RepID=UPI00064DF01B|nr:SPOR domain-containing protein [Puniceibacterium sp. IMCC21224]KMK66320.1 sporulation related protein [Puniceibacterium sp. IMCC21224]